MAGRLVRGCARLGTAVLAVGAVVAGLTVAVGPASAGTSVVGRLDRADRDANGTLTITGWAYDRATPATSVRVALWVDGRYSRVVAATIGRADVNRVRHIHGGHGFSVRIAGRPTARTVSLRTDTGQFVLATRAVRNMSPGVRIVSSARRYVGVSPYANGGASPSGFDCSGYTLYVYQQAGVARLPHSAEGQRRLMRLIPRSQARPGDLIFYMAGGGAFHVAIYAGGGMQYAAATPQDGLRYQGIWSSDVQFGTDWHR